MSLRAKWKLGDQPIESVTATIEDGGGLVVESPCDEDAADPDALSEEPAVLDEIRNKARHSIPSLAEAPTLRFWCGLRTMTEDGRYAVGPDPDVGGLFWVAGLGGSGMVAASEVGRIAAQSLDATSSGEGDVERALNPARLATLPL